LKRKRDDEDSPEDSPEDFIDDAICLAEPMSLRTFIFKVIKSACGANDFV
jgi:hypothetical protein